MLLEQWELVKEEELNRLRVVLHTQNAVMVLNGVSSASQTPLGRSEIELQHLSIIVPTAGLCRGHDRKCILYPMYSWEKELPYIFVNKYVHLCSFFVNGATITCPYYTFFLDYLISSPFRKSIMCILRLRCSSQRQYSQTDFVS